MDNLSWKTICVLGFIVFLLLAIAVILAEC